MKKNPTEVGRIVLSKAGHDEGKRYLVIEEIDNDFVLVADGRLRTMERPKKKRRRHLLSTVVYLEDIATRITSGERLENAFIRKVLLQEEG